MDDDHVTQLNYAFMPDPNPILASVTGANPSTIGLQVLISNVQDPPPSIIKIQIDIPVGDLQGLSSAQDLPNPTYDTTGPWTISSDGSNVTLTPNSANKKPGDVTSPILFTLPGIDVSTQPGTVPIKITEWAPTKATDTSHSLVKQPNDCPVTSFKATPAILTDLDLIPTLTWTCSSQGTQYVYNLRSDGDWGSHGPFTCDDGKKGISTYKLSSQTTFSLDVIQGGVAQSTLSTVVPIIVPTMVYARLTSAPTLMGRVAVVEWIARNAASCTIQVDGTPISTGAPADTYEQSPPYTVVLGGTPETKTVEIIAQNEGGTFQSPPMSAGQVPIPAPATIATGQEPRGSAVTPDGQWGLVTNTTDSTVSFIYLASPEPDPAPISVGQVPVAVAVNPNGTLGIVANSGDGSLTFLNLGARNVISTLNLGSQSQPWSIATTPDGAYALVALKGSNAVALINLSTRQQEATFAVGSSPSGIAFVDTGWPLALVTNTGDDNVSVVLVSQREVVQTIPTGSSPTGIAVSPDRSVALVANTNSNSVTVIDLGSSRQADPVTIPVGNGPYGTAIAATAYGSFGLVTNTESNDVTIIDIAARRAITPSVPVGRVPFSIALTPDMYHALVPCMNSNVAYVL